MKKFLLILLLGCLGLLPFHSFADITIGNGTANQNIPIYPYYGYSYSQTVYLASQINGNGNITTLQFYFSGTSLAYSNTWTIYLGHTTKTIFSSTTDWIPVSSMTQVYSGTFTSPTTSGWITFDITDFAYNGTDNLVIAVDENKASFEATSSNYFYSTYAGASTTYRAILYYNDTNNPDPAAPPTASGRKAYQPNVILGGITPTLPTINVAPTSLAFGYWPSGSTSTEQTYVISGTNLTAGPVVVTAPAGYEVSLTSGSGFASSVNVTYTAPTLANTTIYVRFLPTSANTAYTGNITNVGGGTSANVAVTGYSYEHMKWCTTSQATSTADEDILNVTIGTINNTSTCATTAPGYGSILNRYSNYYYDVTPAGLNKGATFPFSVQVGTCGSNYDNSVAIYIDVNGDGTFDPTAERMYLSAAVTNGPHTETGNITIPINATLGYTMMRVVCNETVPASITPCGSYSWGETEDYKVEILPIISGVFNGHVYDQEGSCVTGISGAKVTLSPSGLIQLTDGTGSFSFPEVPVGTIDMTVTMDGYVSQTITGLTITQGGTTTQDVCLYPDLVAPSGLSAAVTGVSLNDIHVAWQAPGSLPPEQWIHWDSGLNTDALGSNAGSATFIPAIRFTAAEIAPYVGMYLKKIKLYIYDAPVAGSVYLVVYKGSNPPGTAVYTQNVPSVTASSWNEVTLTSPVPITNEEFWIGYQVTSTGAYTYPAGMDGGPGVADRNYFLWGGVWYENVSQGFSNNWNIQGWLSQTSVLAPQQPLIPLVPAAQAAPVLSLGVQTPVDALSEAQNQQNKGTSQFVKLSSDPMASLNRPANAMPDLNQEVRIPNAPATTLLGYNVYRNGGASVYAFVPAPTLFYDDMTLAKGTYCYEVSALYSYGESVKIGPVCAEVFTCYPPTNVQIPIATTTQTQAHVSWTPSTASPNPEWVFEYGPTGFAHGAGIGGIQYIDQDFTTLYSLQAGTTYDFYVATYCTPGDTSSWVKKTFTTHYFDCPGGATAEVEICGDTTNNGCNNVIPTFEPIACGETVCGTGWFNGSTRDTDWFTFTLTQETEVTLQGRAEFSSIFGFIAAPCPATAFITYNTGFPGDTVSVTTTLAAGTYYAFAAPLFEEVVACDSLYHYWVTMSCNTDIFPPAINNVAYTPAACTPVDHLVTADITDDISVGYAKIVWTLNGVAQTDIAMTAGTLPQYSGTIPAQGAGQTIVFHIEAADNATPVNIGTSPDYTIQDDYMSAMNFSAGTDQVVAIGNTTTLDATYSFVTADPGCLKITEFTLYSGGTGATSPYPAYMVSGTYDDIVEITNTGTASVNIGGIHLKCEGSRATDYTFPSALVPPGGVVVVTFGTAADDIPNLYFTTDQTQDVWSSGTNQGIWLTKSDGTTILDAVATNGWTFSVASGVTATDWSGTGVTSASGVAGAGLHGADVNSATNWVAAGTTAQNIGTINSSVTVSCGPATSFTVTWSGGNLPAPVVGDPITTPAFNTAGIYTFTATLSDGTCTVSDDVNVEIPVPVIPVANFTVNDIYQMAGATFTTAIFTDMSTNMPTSWNWNITGPGAVTFVDATTAASQNPHVQFGAPGLYTVELTASNLAGSGVETKTDYIQVFLSYCTSMASNIADEEIYSVTVNGVNNALGCGVVAPGPGSIAYRYSNFYPLGSLTSVAGGSTVDFTVQEDECNGGTYYAFGTGIWIDYNQDGDFDDPDEAVFIEASTLIGPRDVTGSFVVPSSALGGVTAMRITVAEDISGAGLTPCLAYSYGETEDYLITIVPPAYKTLNLTLFLEGLYGELPGNPDLPPGTMHEALNDLFEPQFGAGIADQVTIELRNDADYTVLEYSSGPVDLTTAGEVVLSDIPATLGGSYWITVLTRNCILTVSSAPVDLSGATTSYDFSTAATQAYFDNEKDMLDGYFALWSGDVNQDLIIDSGDMNPVDNDATNVIFIGYSPNDLNGDGIADSGDINIVDNNATAVIIGWTP